MLEGKIQVAKLTFTLPEESRYSLEFCNANTTWSSLISYDSISVTGGRMQQMFESASAEKHQRKCYLPKMFIPVP